jgi:hypothetical protein
MSYENTKCPCGGEKDQNTMLCNGCFAELEEHPAMKIFKDESARVESRRHAAFILISCSNGIGKRRKKA